MPEVRQSSPQVRRERARGERSPLRRLRARVQDKPGLLQVYRGGIFVAGLVCVLAGFALAVLPGPLTIPPVLLGLYLWSTEFAWAKRFFNAFQKKARDAWAHAKAHSVSSAAITVGGLVAAGAAFWAVGHFELVDRGREAAGL